MSIYRTAVLSGLVLACVSAQAQDRLADMPGYDDFTTLGPKLRR
jgi:hypothetical protein